MKSILLSTLADSRHSSYLIPRSQLIKQIYLRETFWNCFGWHHSELYRKDFSIIEANVTNNSICRKENILEYQFHSELGKVRSLNKVSLLQLFTEPYSVTSHIINIILTDYKPLQFAKFSLMINHKQFSPISTMKYSRPSSILLIVDNLDDIVYLPKIFYGLVAVFLQELIQ
ncbi:Hypothetical_protein [Hexamita inflata]|uniref:Hypothetical_protein n=1 Tax=Hexamita inflata TaxID=28002 RepID=A0AA86QSZ8_9EUKA|nr:Hypothetical protein HINF_LOCUS48641 [Hexamita inflata]